MPDALRTGMVRRRQLLEAALPEDARARLAAAADAADVARQKGSRRRWSGKSSDGIVLLNT